jgi:endonuclease/exonuclease/phosphatase family metal-dependent hydrolase
VATWHDLRWRLVAPAVVTLVLVEVLLVWLPSVSFGVAQVLGLRPALGALAGVGLLALVPIVTASSRPPPRLAWRLGGAALVAGRLALVLDAGFAVQLAGSSLAVVGGVLAITGLAGSGVGRIGRTGVVFGAVVASWLHTGLGTLDLTWRSGLGATLGGIVLAGTVAFAVLRVAPPEEPDPDDAAWPWFTMGPILLLLLLLVTVPGRVAAPTGWEPGRVAAVTALLGGLTVVAALGAPMGPRRAVAPLGGVLVALGTAGVLPAAGTSSVVAQAILAAGLGLAVGSTTGAAAGTTALHRSVAAGVGWLLFGVLVVGYYAGYDLGPTAPARWLLVAAAVALTFVGLTARRRVVPIASEPLHPGRAALRMLAITIIGALGVALAASPVREATARATGPDAPVRVVLANLNYGWGPDGRFDPRATAATLRALEPDVVVLNEVGRGWLIDGNHDLLQLLAADLGMPFRFAPAADEMAGNAVLASIPITESVTERLPRGEDRMQRSLLAVVVTPAPERPLAVVATQLTTVDENGTSRLAQARAVAAMVARSRERQVPTVVAGDLRAAPGSPELEAFGGTVTSAVPQGTLTYPAEVPAEQPDHVLHSPDLAVTELEILDVTLSDHRPVAVTFETAAP